MLGKFLQNFNAPESIAASAMYERLRGVDLFRYPHLIRSLRLEEVNARLRAHFDWGRSAVVSVRPAASGGSGT